MSSILESLRLDRNYVRSPLTEPLDFDYACRKTDAVPRECGFGFNEQYRMSVTVSTEFWANDATIAKVKKEAEKMLLQQLHKDILGHIATLRVAVTSGRGEDALRICDKILADIGL